MSGTSNWRRRQGAGAPIVIGNWKMNAAPRTLLAQVECSLVSQATASVGFAVPHTLIAASAAMSGLPVGSQDIHEQAAGAFTGCVSADMVRDAGGTFTIIGHSECREQFGENGPTLRAKVERAVEAGLTVVQCCGEPMDVRRNGGTNAYVRQQLEDALAPEASLHLVIAYEPRWCIGTGMQPDQRELTDALRAIRASLREISPRLGDRAAVIYGGSVNGTNARSLAAVEELDGLLVGGSSLSSTEMNAIIRAFA